MALYQEEEERSKDAGGTGPWTKAVDERIRRVLGQRSSSPTCSIEIIPQSDRPKRNMRVDIVRIVENKTQQTFSSRLLSRQHLVTPLRKTLRILTSVFRRCNARLSRQTTMKDTQMVPEQALGVVTHARSREEQGPRRMTPTNMASSKI